MNFKQLSVIAISLILCIQGQAFAKKKKPTTTEGFKFTSVSDIPTTGVRNQESTGTCWTFATTSFIETELIRLGAGNIDLSEMFTVRHAYTQKALKYFRLHGKGNFSEGGQAHDVLNVVKEFGFVPETAYSGNQYGSEFNIHQEMVKSTKAMLDEIIKNPNRTITPVWQKSVNGVFDTYMGATPEKFDNNGQTITPVEYMKETGFNPNDYIELTSYSHHPYYKEMDLEIPDNWSHDLYYNLPIDELMAVIDNALTNDYSVCWDGDVSEKGFSHRNGVAILPAVDTKDMTNSEIEKWDAMSAKEKKASLYKFDKPRAEKKVDQTLRQATFDNYKTTDDHLMHLTGIVKDQNGTRYYKTKNSWAKNSNKMGGYLNMSEAYVRLKTVAIMVHKDAIPAELKAKLGL
ncbi:aminopeptidase C [Ancylomarina sp. 16SWW S1-10-2]|uniref:aminopeptidase C n=1 Tax=Ancylomarina sp. 16SWW S1-10-2 TaxID=2499681 RepID=UPI0012AD4763|nr:C1 family peptidase [Ancylomarina sp. 16SWW S1-10-2]MRT92471.1 aminopeptidase [Ancylomarina sp. 16SWW S1-10-2]